MRKIYRQSALAILFLLLCVQSAVCDVQTWLGNAHDVKQIITITVGGTTWADGTATITSNGKDIVVTPVGSESEANIATAIKEALASSTRLDGTGTTDATSNAGGQEFGEFSEIIWTVSGSVITGTAAKAGVPITISVSETSTAGTLTLATPQAATGKHFFDNPDNWDTGAAPVDDDVLIYRDNNVSCKYNLANGTLEVTLQVYKSYTGEIGLPRTNVDNPQKPYNEYRQRYARFDNSGSGTNIAHRFGIGQEGTGSPLINVKHSIRKCSPIVYATGNPLPTRGGKALNICCTANDSTLNILGGSVDYSSQDGATAAFRIIAQVGGDSRSINGIHTSSASVTISGGTALIGGTGAINQILVKGGTLKLENQTGTITDLRAQGGAIEYASTGTITGLIVEKGGVFDARHDAGAFTVTDGDVYEGGKFLDPYRRMSVGASNFNLHFDPSPDIQFGARVGNPIVVAP